MAEDATEAPQSTAQEMGDRLAAMEEDQPESTQAPEQDAKTEEAPDYFGDNFDPSTLPEELQPAYKQLRGDYTRKTQELAEQRKEAESANALLTDLQSGDPEAQQSALTWMAQNGLLSEQAVADIFGLEIDDQPDQAAEEDDDPVSALRRELDEVRNNLSSREQREQQAREQQQAEAQIAEADAHIGRELAAIAKDRGVDELPPDEQQLIVSRALVAYTQPGQMPDVKAAYKDLETAWNARQSQWAASKQATHVNPGGKAATQVPDLDNDQERRDHMAEQLAALGNLPT